MMSAAVRDLFGMARQAWADLLAPRDAALAQLAAMNPHMAKRVRRGTVEGGVAVVHRTGCRMPPWLHARLQARRLRAMVAGLLAMLLTPFVVRAEEDVDRAFEALAVRYLGPPELHGVNALALPTRALAPPSLLAAV
jgi:hypothetical protein